MASSRPAARSVLISVLIASAAAAQQKQWPYSMDFGPYQMTTVDGGGTAGWTYKGVVVHLPDAGVVFDTEQLRASLGWLDGSLRLRGTAYDGAHGPMCSVRGRRQWEVQPGPGWAKGGEFTDPRKGEFGPLPRDWGRYRGLYLHGNDVVISYEIGGMGVLESYGLERDGDDRVLARTLNLEPSDREQWMVVADLPEGARPAGAVPAMPASGGRAPTAAFTVLQWPTGQAGPVETDVSGSDWDSLPMGGPSAGDYLDRASGTGATIAAVPGFAPLHGGMRRAQMLNDGAAAENEDDTRRSVWFDRHKVGDSESDDGRFVADLQKVVDVSRVNTFTWHRQERAPQQYELFGSAADAAPDAAAADPAAAGWQSIAKVDTRKLGEGDKHGVGISKPDGLGRYRHLLFVVRSGGAFFSEIDVWADRFRTPRDASGRPDQAGLTAAVKGEPGRATLVVKGSRLLLSVPAHRERLRLKLLVQQARGAQAFAEAVAASGEAADLQPLTRGGGARWGEPIATVGEVAADDDAYVVDTLTIPFDNRFGSNMRVCAFDFFRDGRAAISTWNGDVWIVSGIDARLEHLQWRRFATGLFDPLGLKIVDDVVYVHGRDGISRLHDLDGDGEADFYECFNHDVETTRAFHEFAFDLQTDPEGNFYCSKAGPVNPGGRGFMQVAAHHGTVMKISKDGSKLEVIATGLRAPNGIGVSPDGKIFTTGDNEGTYIPHCRLNWFTEPGFYAGVKDTAHRSPVPDQADLPLCWFPMEVDNSSGGQTWVTSQRWGPLEGRLLHLSYGTCSLFLVLKEDVGGQVQGGVVRFPCSFSSSCMRGRFDPQDGQLYVAGFKGWQTSAAKDGGFHRVRYTGKPVLMPTQLRTSDKGIYLTFLEPLDPEVAEDPDSYGVQIWNYLYSQNYGSPELSILHPDHKVEQGLPNRDPLAIKAAKLSADRKTVFLSVPDIQPCMQMQITYHLETADGKPVKGDVYNSIHALSKDAGMPATH